jgi:hypothetical protein
MLPSLLMFAVVGFSGCATTPDEKSTGDWYEFLFQGQKVGFMYSEHEPTTVNDRPAVHVKNWTVISVLRTANQKIRIESTTDTWSEPDGKPMRYKHTRGEGGETRSSEGYRDGDVFIIHHAVGDNMAERKIKLEPGMVLSTFIDRLLAKDLKKGKELKGKAIIEEDGEAKDFTVKVLSSEKRKEGEVFIVQSIVAGLESRTVMAADGKTLELEIPGLGAKLIKSTREKALVLDATVDVFSAAQFSVKKPLPGGDQLEELVVELRGKSGKRPTFVSDQRQKGKPVGKNGVELRVFAQDAPLKSPSLPIKDAKVQQFLKETPYEPLNDEKLRGTVQRVVGGEKNTWEAAKKINAFVYGHIKRKTLARAFATATEALETAEGDCTEHAVLFSALAKIAGIPVRLLTGLVYVGGKNNLFGYHEWVEVYVGDKWIAMDPTFGQNLADATHLMFTRGMSDSDGLREAGLAAASLIGELELDVVEYTTSSGEKTKM